MQFFCIDSTEDIYKKLRSPFLNALKEDDDNDTWIISLIRDEDGYPIIKMARTLHDYDYD